MPEWFTCASDPPAVHDGSHNFFLSLLEELFKLRKTILFLGLLHTVLNIVHMLQIFMVSGLSEGHVTSMLFFLVHNSQEIPHTEVCDSSPNPVLWSCYGHFIAQVWLLVEGWGPRKACLSRFWAVLPHGSAAGPSGMSRVLRSVWSVVRQVWQRLALTSLRWKKFLWPFLGKENFSFYGLFWGGSKNPQDHGWKHR